MILKHFLKIQFFNPTQVRKCQISEIIWWSDRRNSNVNDRSCIEGVRRKT